MTHPIHPIHQYLIEEVDTNEKAFINCCSRYNPPTRWWCFVAETAEISLDIQQQMEAVLASPEAILMSQPNVTTATQLLVALPEPETKIPIAVYAIRDNTGQLKADMGAASTVVTQGATEMLITALHRSRQFKILDRSNFADFINEQNLVVQNRVVSGKDLV